VLLQSSYNYINDLLKY